MDGPIYLSRSNLQEYRWTIDQFSPSKVHSIPLGMRLCRQNSHAGSLHESCPGEVPVLQLWRCHADFIERVKLRTEEFIYRNRLQPA